MDMYFEAERYYQKKLEKLGTKFDEKDTIITRQAGLIMHLIRIEQDLTEQIKSAQELNNELNNELNKDDDKELCDGSEKENKTGNKLSLPQMCSIM